MDIQYMATPIWCSIKCFHKSDLMVMHSQNREGSWTERCGGLVLFQKMADILSYSFFFLCFVKTDFVSACLFVTF